MTRRSLLGCGCAALLAAAAGLTVAAEAPAPAASAASAPRISPHARAAMERARAAQAEPHAIGVSPLSQQRPHRVARPGRST